MPAAGAALAAGVQSCYRLPVFIARRRIAAPIPTAARQVNALLVLTNDEIGRRIVEHAHGGVGPSAKISETASRVSRRTHKGVA
jgi:hypothetical protein